MAMIGGKTYRKLGLKIVNITDLKISRNDFNDFFLMKLNIEILIVEHKKFLNSKLPSRLQCIRKILSISLSKIKKERGLLN